MEEQADLVPSLSGLRKSQPPANVRKEGDSRLSATNSLSSCLFFGCQTVHLCRQLFRGSFMTITIVIGDEHQRH